MKHILLSLVLLSSCDRGAAPLPATPSAPEQPAIPTVDVVPVVAEKLDTRVRLPGEIVPYESVALYPRASAFVEEVLVDRGAAVKKGQLLSRLSAPELHAQRAEAESQLLAARSTYKRTLAASATQGAVAKHELEVGEASMRALESKVQALKTLEGYLLVRAPFEGQVTERNVHPGALVGPPSGPAAVPMLRLESIQHLRLTVAVPESDVGSVAEGATAEFGVRTWPGETFTGVIRRIARSLDVRTRTMPVELDVDNSAGRLSAGMFAEVSWPVRRQALSLFVPPSAIVQTTEKTYVDRVQDGIIDQVEIKRGVVLPDRVEVFGALQAKDLVLRRGSEDLKSGARVLARTVSTNSH